MFKKGGEETDSKMNETQKKDNMRVIALNKKHICPFLNEQKLCRLVEINNLTASSPCPRSPHGN